MTQLGYLYLIPVPLFDEDFSNHIPKYVVEKAKFLNYFIVEDAKTARKFLKTIPTLSPLQTLVLSELNEHTPKTQIPALLEPLLQGFDVGLMSEAGCPAIADPGSELVSAAHQHGITVVPMVGPSSILLALMASGGNNLHFSFQGYLPAKTNERNQTLKKLDSRCHSQNETIIFIETPYRNEAMFESILQFCQPHTFITLALNLTMQEQSIQSKTVSNWRSSQEKPNLKNNPCVFVMHSFK